MNNIKEKLVQFLVSSELVEFNADDFKFMANMTDDFIVENWIELSLIVTLVYGTISKYNIFEEIVETCQPGVQKMINHPHICQLISESGETNSSGKTELVGAFSIFCDSMDQFIKICPKPPYPLRYVVSGGKKYKIEFNNPYELALFMLSRVKYNKKILIGCEKYLQNYPKILCDAFGDHI